MSSFQKIWENMQIEKKEQKDDRSMSVIRTGLGVSDSFWDDFLKVINNSEGLSELLDVPVTKISTWRSKINHVLQKIKETDKKSKHSKNKKLLKTGLPNEKDYNDLETDSKE